jgi:uncharacterized protein YkwD
MNYLTHCTRTAIAVTVFSVLTACGGGGGDDDGGSGGSPVVGRNGTVDVGSVNLPGGQTCNIPGFAQALIAEINAARAQARNCGATAMPAAPAIGYWNTRLTDAALRHSSDRVAIKGRGHVGSDGSQPQDRANAAGYDGFVAEVLMTYFGSTVRPSVSSAVQGWVGSEGHCRALMDPEFKELGAACVRSSDWASFTVVLGGQ